MQAPRRATATVLTALEKRMSGRKIHIAAGQLTQAQLVAHVTPELSGPTRDGLKRGGRVDAVPLTQAQANEFIARLHRHHKPSRGDKFRIGAEHDGQLVGVVQVGRPVARGLDDGKTLEVTRLCTDGTPNACSYLYSKAARVAKELGYERIITYILDIEDGTSLKATGWKKTADVKGQEWCRPSRPRQTSAPTCDKQRWEKQLHE